MWGWWWCCCCLINARTIQITTYTHKDENNKWLIKPYNDEIKPNEKDVVLVKHGDLIRLEHTQTKRNLHSHKEQAPLTKKMYQVSGYGEVNDRNLFIFVCSFSPFFFHYHSFLVLHVFFCTLYLCAPTFFLSSFNFVQFFHVWPFFSQMVICISMVNGINVHVSFDVHT